MTAGFLVTFLLVLTRVLCIFVFFPFPGAKNVPDIPKLLLACCMTLVLLPVWPALPVPEPSIGQMAVWIVTEASFGIAVGLLIAVVSESFTFGAQLIATQAGYSYASTVDPATNADSGLLVVFFQLFTGVCFFATGFHLTVVRVIAKSLTALPPGTTLSREAGAQLIARVGTIIMSTGLRMALPVIGLLLLTDLCIALTSRIASQLQILTVAFPAKMLTCIGFLSALAATAFALYQSTARWSIDAIRDCVK